LKKDEQAKKDETAEAAAPETAAEQAASAETGAAAPAAEKPAEPDWKDQYVRLMADFDNFKKRTARDREETYRYAEADILKDLLPTVDNLALALGSAKDKDDDFVKGVQLVYDSFLSALKDHGAEPFDSVGLELDPEKMEAIATLPSPDFEEGRVSTEVKRGWLLKEKLLRAAQVVVSSGKTNG
jgi:molecular chaperone GrpE